MNKEIDLMALMALPRKERRRLAKLNGIARIAGSNTPYVNEAKRKRKAEAQSR